MEDSSHSQKKFEMIREEPHELSKRASSEEHISERSPKKLLFDVFDCMADRDNEYTPVKTKKYGRFFKTVFTAEFMSLILFKL